LAAASRWETMSDDAVESTSSMRELRYAKVLIGGGVGVVGWCCWVVLLGGVVGWCCWVVLLGGVVGWCCWVVVLGGGVGWWCWVVVLGGLRYAKVLRYAMSGVQKVSTNETYKVSTNESYK
jgi:hypothetical protein